MFYIGVMYIQRRYRNGEVCFHGELNPMHTMNGMKPENRSQEATSELPEQNSQTLGVINPKEAKSLCFDMIGNEI